MILELKNLSYRFSDSKEILNTVSLNLEKGKIYALMGANGSGKTTLFNIVTGFITPRSGSILFESTEIKDLSPHRINRLGIGRTFQDLRLVSKLTVKENVRLAMKNDPTQVWHQAVLPKSFFREDLEFANKIANEIIKNCFLENVQDNLADEISYGQQKLLNLACCIANDGDLFLLDEPIAGINPQYQERILKLLRRLRSQGKTVLLIEHNTEFLRQIADRFFFLRDGTLKAFETFDELRNDREVLDAYLEA